MKVINRYIVKNLVLATVFITFTLSAVIVLTQSLRFLELIIESGASAGTFWTLTLLALPRFWEVILPIAIMIATTFTYNRLKDGSELVILRSTGFSPFSIAKPALTIGLLFTLLLWLITLWATPYSMTYLQKIKQAVKSQFSTLLLHEGVFNRLGNNFTVYVQNRNEDGSLSGIMIYDNSRKNNNNQPYTILAKRGIVSEENGNYQILVFDGSQQSFNPATRVLQRLNFDRYIIDLPLSTQIEDRWKQPDERTLMELLHPNPDVIRNIEYKQKFKTEIHRRLTAPLMAISFTMIACAFLILGPIQRHNNNTWRIMSIVLGTVILQGLFIGVYNYAKNNPIGILYMYSVPIIPIIITAYLLSPWGEKKRRTLLYQNQEGTP